MFRRTEASCGSLRSALCRSRRSCCEAVGKASWRSQARPFFVHRPGRLGGVTPALRSIPGVGIRTAEAVAAFVDDPDRFRSAKAVGRYFGLVPCQDQSGDRNRLGHITREGAPVVRQLLAEAAWQARRRSPTVRAYFERVQRGDPQRKKIALVATAHYLVRVMWSLLKHGTSWEEDPARAN